MCIESLMMVEPFGNYPGKYINNYWVYTAVVSHFQSRYNAMLKKIKLFR